MAAIQRVIAQPPVAQGFALTLPQPGQSVYPQAAPSPVAQPGYAAQAFVPQAQASPVPGGYGFPQTQHSPFAQALTQAQQYPQQQWQAPPQPLQQVRVLEPLFYAFFIHDAFLYDAFLS